ncbi:tetratricopeptide repeat protein [Avibacterium paragallinarum]|uniref:Sel1 repeat family protein n=1 Tax=Avibacterium paragallinarum TaxID=728 RepID=A0AAE5TK40_AVIPA|nr:sel1 repeat family protein [Avibacterium paragallinarum]MEE3608311.1 sel1 repeat family protein [Avibacterium paragallinarum]MEE3621361.1 sel1 repeat family protein [Avibacterium paragallinarum]MEE3668067.1 sel1 repeat family protein [Avibacterium paragallinarum]MEE3681154.1 sel1 repeat family protein [Avibacterium paragallinarum]MEE4386348.1 sel1 repeat family protein [Avibacterium paragallinarum]
MKMRKTLIASVVLTLSFNAMAVNEVRLEKAKKGDYKSMQAMADSYCSEGNLKESFYWQGKLINYLRAKDNLSEQDKAQLEFYMTKLADGYLQQTCSPKVGEIVIGVLHPDDRSAAFWFNELVSIGNPVTYYPYYAKWDLKWRYESGKGVQPNRALAKQYLRELAELSDDKVISKNTFYTEKMREIRGGARYGLAEGYYIGDYFPQDDELAYYWATQAAQDNYAWGKILMSGLLFLGRGVEQDKQTALRIIRETCETTSFKAPCKVYKEMKEDKLDVKLISLTTFSKVLRKYDQ